MAFKNFRAEKREAGKKTGTQTPVSVATPAPAQPTPPTATFIDGSTQIEGTVRCKETLRIDGQLSGELECEKTVLVRQGAKVTANIAAETVQVSGEVKGNISARRKITLDRTARVNGDLATPGIVIEEGAKLKGRIVIGSETKSSEESRSEATPDANPIPEQDIDEVPVSLLA
jgi:cytoskeletal protein CcmA (bactofilin family)